MTATAINGKVIVEAKREAIKHEVAALTGAGLQPGLAVILIGNDPASAVYVRNKAKACEQVGIYSEVHQLPAETSETEVLALIARLNRDSKIHGILVQSPPPAHIDEQKLIDAVHPDKDVDCFHPVNVGNLVQGKPGFLPCTPAGIMEVLRHEGVSVAGKHAVVVGRSHIVGKPMAMLLLQEHATVSICHSRTPDLGAITRQADILVVAVGRKDLIRKEHVKPGAIVIDVGMNRNEAGKLCGDVDFAGVSEVAGLITPVPGVVGPMTITMLLQNTVTAAKRARG